MDARQNRNSPYVIAFIGSIIILTSLPIFFYFVLIFVTSDPGGPLNLVLIPCLNLFASIIFTGVVFLPLSALLEWLRKKGNKNYAPERIQFFFWGSVLLLILVVITAGFVFAAGIILGSPLALQLLGNQDIHAVSGSLFRFLFLGGIPLVLGGVTYGFLLQLSRKLISNRQDQSELTDESEPG